MHTLYDIASGPLVWVSFVLFVGGSIYKLASAAILARKKDIVVYEYASAYYALRSILHWIVPFGSTNMRKRPVMTVAAFAFHLCLLIAPLFLFAHIVLVKESWNVSWGYVSDGAADIMTIIVIAGCIFFLVRRLVIPEAKYLTSPSDYLILALVALPFVTGLWTHRQWFGCGFTGILHILSGEALLIAIPFTRLSHMLFFPFTRGYTGSEFGSVRHAKDW
jgi:nitrate reductase gamma subunit